MSFATKKCALNWANDYLEKSAEKGKFADPIYGSTVQAIKRFGYWDFGFSSDWIHKVEDLYEAKAKNEAAGQVISANANVNIS